MILVPIAFYMFSAIAIGSALAVITARNPVHSVLFLILCFFTVAGLFVLLGAEFVAMILIVVYVGAVMVLFLFVVMMLDVDFAELRSGFLEYLPIGGLIGLILLVELFLVLAVWAFAPDIAGMAQAPTPDAGDVTNTRALGQVLYTQYVYYFQAAGVILFIAMIGAIVLTLREKKGSRRQVIYDQIERDPKTAIENKDVKPGAGIV